MKLILEKPPEFKKRRYLMDGEEVPSVTTVLAVLQKGSLPWWGMTVGVDGLLKLIDQGLLPGTADADECVQLLTEHELTVNHVRDKSADRGTSVHTALEQWLTEERVPRPGEFLPEDRGYVQALAKAMLALQPEPLDVEVIVGSKTHRYAGTYDLLCHLDGRRTRLDLKTGKKVYPEAHIQVAAYEMAAVEMGEEPTERQVILRLDRSGEFELELGRGTPQMFLGVLAAYRALEALKATKPDKRKKKAAA